MTILITGSSGKTSSHLAQQLASDGRDILIASRSPKPNSAHPTARFNWLDESTWGLPFSHEQAQESPIRAVYLVSPDLVLVGVDSNLISFVNFARQKGVKRFVLLSAWELPEGGPALGQDHAQLKALEKEGVEWAVVRPHFFMENFLESYHLDSIKNENKIYAAADEGKKPFIWAGDIAAVAARLLTDEKPHNTDYVITGSESLSYGDVADTFSEVLGRKIELVKLSKEEFRAKMIKIGMEEPMAEYMAELDVRVSNGEGKDPTDLVKKVTGKDPRTFKQFVQDHKAAWMP